jgi:hypothetical protein
MKTKTVLALVGIVLPMVVAAGVRAADDDPPKTAADSINKAFALLKAGDGAAAARYFPSRPGTDPAENMKPGIDILKSGEISLAVVPIATSSYPQRFTTASSTWKLAEPTCRIPPSSKTAAALGWARQASPAWLRTSMVERDFDCAPGTLRPSLRIYRCM